MALHDGVRAVIAESLVGRLEVGRPLLIGSDAQASLASRGVRLEGEAALGRLLREAPSAVADHYDREIAAGIDVLAAITADTMPRALGRIGMAFRSAALTGVAVDLAHEARERAPRPIAIAGELGARWIAPTHPERIADEYATHAARLAAAECEVLLARGYAPDASRPVLAGASLPPPPASTTSRLTRMASVVSGVATMLPTWAILEVGPGMLTPDGEEVVTCACEARDAGAGAVLVEAKGVDVALRALDLVAGATRLPCGVLLGAFEHQAPEGWAADAKRILEAGARVLGGGLGATVKHVAALAKALGRADRSSIWPRAV